MAADEHSDLERVAALLALTIPDECLPGILANLELLKHHTHILEAYVAHEEKTS